MNTIVKSLFLFLLLSYVSVLGCSQRPGGSRSDARIRNLQTRNAKWEEDYRVIMSTNAGLRKQLALHRNQSTELKERLYAMQALTAERDEMRAQLQKRTAQRDVAQNQLLELQRDLTGLVGRLQTATRSMNGPTPQGAGANMHLVSSSNMEGD